MSGSQQSYRGAAQSDNILPEGVGTAEKTSYIPCPLRRMTSRWKVGWLAVMKMREGVMGEWVNLRIPFV